MSHSSAVTRLTSLPRPNTQVLDGSRVRAAKRAFSTRRISLADAGTLITGAYAPRSGDLVLAEVIKIGHHTKLESSAGRRQQMFPGDEILVVYGDRYAPDQFEARVPEDLGPCQLVAGGGIAAIVEKKSVSAKPATQILPIGVVADETGTPLSTRNYTLDWSMPKPDLPPVLVVVGSAMNAGKTATMGALAKGAAQTGLKVAAIKATGTGSGGDLWTYLDAGAHLAFDFTDAGLATTYRAGAERIEAAIRLLTQNAARRGADLILLEIADGLLCPETADLVVSQTIQSLANGVLFAASDAMSALTGESWLRQRGLPVVALSGVVTKSPLAIEEIKRHARVPVLTLQDMQSSRIIATDLMGRQTCSA